MFCTIMNMKKIIYDTSICIMAISSVIFSIIDISSGLPFYLSVIDNVIYMIFVADYIMRFAISKNKKAFFRQNIFDLIAIIPIGSAIRIFRTFKVFRLFKIAKLSKLTKLTRLIAVSSRFLNKCRNFLNTNGFKYILSVSCVLILIGGSLISYFENMSFIDGIWWAFVTSTTVGYGDISPTTAFGRIIACILMITGIGLIGSLTSSLTSFFIKNDDISISNDRIDMVVKLYDELNDSEKEEFKNIIM